MYNVIPKNIAKTKEFYLLWSIFFCLTCLLNFVNSYKKTYAQKFIQDDQFFAAVAIVQNIFNGTARLLWGNVYDKMGFQVNERKSGSVDEKANGDCKLVYQRTGAVIYTRCLFSVCSFLHLLCCLSNVIFLLGLVSV